MKVLVLVEQKLSSPFDIAQPADIARKMKVSHSYITRVKNKQVRLSQEQYNKLMKIALDLTSHG